LHISNSHIPYAYTRKYSPQQETVTTNTENNATATAKTTAPETDSTSTREGGPIRIGVDNFKPLGFFAPLQKAPKELMERFEQQRLKMAYPNSPAHQAETLRHANEYGGKRETIAVFSVKGRLIARVDASGGATTPMAARIPNDPNMKPQDKVEFLEKRLSAMYGKGLVVDKYQPGQSPTNAELFSKFNFGKSYAQHIQDQLESMRGEYAAAQYRKEQYEHEQEQRNSIEQRQVFKLNGIEVASIDDDGKLRIHAPLIGNASVQHGLPRDAMQPLATMELRSFNNPVNGDGITKLFRDKFGDALTVEKFTQGNGPTLGEIREAQSRHLDNYLDSINVTA